MDISIDSGWNNDYSSLASILNKVLCQVKGVSHISGSSDQDKSSKAKLVSNLKSPSLLLVGSERV